MNVTSSAQSGEPFSYFIPLPMSARVIAFGLAAFNAALLIRSLPDLHQNPLVLYLWFGGCFTWTFILIWAIQPQKWRGRLEFTSTNVTHIPNPFMLKFGETSRGIPIVPNAKEILICRGSGDTLLNSSPTKGFRVIVRSMDGQNRELKVDTGEILRARQAKLLSDGIHSATGFPVRLVFRENSEGAAPKEMPWTPAGRVV